MEPTRPVKTAMVLLEFHQPRGAAWFDNVTLFSGAGSEHNLLAAPGFEEEDVAAIQAEAISAGYEEQVRALLKSLEAAVKSATPAQAIPALGEQVDALAALVTGKGLAPYFPRELRDLDDARETLGLCARLLAAPR